MDLVIKSGFGRKAIFAGLRPGRLLDVPAGAGGYSKTLGELGYAVVSMDLMPPAARATPLSWVRADANQPFPFASESFDYVLSREGIEHLENQVGFVRECARVLKAGGTLVITTPNLMHLSARFSYLLTGQRNLKRGLVNEVQTLRMSRGPHLYHGHVFMIDYFRLRYLLRLAGFDELAVYTDRYSPTAIGMAPLAPLLWAAARFSVWTAARNNRRKGLVTAPAPVTDEIIGHVHSSALLFGKRMIVAARRAAT
ncbi:MAG TPA: methyltransferase domain-containing protein [Candidatus Binataceae bacterium]|nr:methyltransferase domain-containing protein [Candidatus Binataceae bacterium]